MECHFPYEANISTIIADHEIPSALICTFFTLVKIKQEAENKCLWSEDLAYFVNVFLMHLCTWRRISWKIINVYILQITIQCFMHSTERCLSTAVTKHPMIKFKALKFSAYFQY